MTAAVLREAAAKIRRHQARVGVAAFCNCSDETSAWFDRGICPEPCGQMHYICEECGGVQGRCAIRDDELKAADRVTRTWLAVADWLNLTADHMDPELAIDGGCPDCEDNGALKVATAYLGGA